MASGTLRSKGSPNDAWIAFTTPVVFAMHRSCSSFGDRAIRWILLQMKMSFTSPGKKLNFPPGDGFLYSNTGYTLLGEIVKRVSGKSIREFTDREDSSTARHSEYSFPRRSCRVDQGSGVRIMRAIRN